MAQQRIAPVAGLNRRYDRATDAYLGLFDAEGNQVTTGSASPSIASILASTGLRATLAATTWGAEAVPSYVQLAGHHILGRGAATLFKLPLQGAGAYPTHACRTMDADGNWWELPQRLAVSQMQLGAAGDAKLIGGTKTGTGGFVGSGVTGGTPTGTDDSAIFAQLFDGHLKVPVIEPYAHICGGDTVRIASFSKIRGFCPAGYVNSAQGAGYDPASGQDEYLAKGIPYIYVKGGTQAAFNVANNTAADQAGSVDPITWGYGIDIEGIAIDAWSDTTSSTDNRSCISAGSTRLRLRNCHLIRGTYGVGGAATGGSIYTHTLEMDQCTVGTCWRGVGNLIDSFVDAQIANCYTTGWFGTNGSNATTFTGRIEFTQAGRGIELQSSSKCTGTNALCDRNWLAGARLTSCVSCVFDPSWIWNRNGRGQVGVDDDECNIFRQGCVNCDDWGSHGRGVDDFNGALGYSPGHFSPKHCATYNQVNTNCGDRGNHATGFANFYPVTETGTAQGGSLTTITLASGSSGESGYYNDDVITITGGTGNGQTGTVVGYSGGSKVATVTSWSGGVAPDATSTYSIPTGAPTLGTTGPILYMSGRNKTQMPGHLVDAIGSERYDNGRTLQEISGRRVYDNPFSAVLAAAGGTGNLACSVIGPATSFAIQSMKLRIVARDSNSPSTSYVGECLLRVREEAVGSVVVEPGHFVWGDEIGASGYAGFGSGVFGTGTCQAGSTATTVVLAAGSSSTTDGFVGYTITTTGGTGSGQTNVCTGYNGTSKTMSLKRPWATIPDNTTTYSLSFGSTIQLGFSSAAVVPHPTDPTMQIATFTLAVTNRHAANSVRVFTEFMQ